MRNKLRLNGAKNAEVKPRLINQSITFISGSMAHRNTRQTRQTGIYRQQ